MPEPDRFTLDEIRNLAGRGLGKVDLWGPRGASLVSTDETIAMAMALAIIGLVPIPPGAVASVSGPDTNPIKPLKGPADA